MAGGWPWLRSPEATRVINQLWPDDLKTEQQQKEDAAIHARLQREALNDATFTAYIRKMWQAS